MKKTVLCGICMLMVVAGCRLSNAPSKNVPAGDGGKDDGDCVLHFSAAPAEGGAVTAKTKAGRPINNGERLPKNTEIVFTTTAANEYYIDKWTGADGLTPANDNQTATLKLTADTAITVHFSKMDVENMNWKASGKITDKNGNKHNMTMIINDDGKYLTILEDNQSYTIIPVQQYDKATASIITHKAFKIKVLSKPMQLPANWTIRFEGDAVLEKDGAAALRIKSGTEATVKVVYNNNNQTGANGPYID